MKVSLKVSFLPMFRGRGLVLAFLTFLLCLSLPGSRTAVLAAPASSPQSTVRLPGNLPVAALAGAKALGRVPSSQMLTLDLALPLRDSAGLGRFLDRLYDPADPLYRHYLTPAEFTERFGPTQQSYDAVAAFARSRGLVVTHVSPGRLLLTVSGSTATVESAFGVHLGRYQAADGRVFHAPDSDPAVPAALASRISAVIGLDNAGVWKSHAVRGRSAPRFGLKPSFPTSAAHPGGIGTDVNTGGLTPSDIKAAYGLGPAQTKLTGTGQTLALLELDGYTPSDISTYVSTYGLTSVPLENILLDGYDGSAGADASEVTLDIEVMNALAPGASKILVYEAPNSAQGIIDLYTRMADDDRANQLSSSWGIHSENAAQSLQSTENVIFQKMATQGQSFYVITGDYGAYDDGVQLSVEDPSTQQMVTAVGGTKLAVTRPGGPYQSEGAWGAIDEAGPSNPKGAGGGGGISDIWSIPSYQVGVPGLASTTQRNTPDVSLDADPATGYAIYYQGQWVVYGGTSVATPLWAAFGALVNQQRAVYGYRPLGFANPTLYSFGPGGVNAAKYSLAFHDPADGTTNLFYPTKPGYDNATGLGSFNGTSMLALLAPPPNTTSGAIASLKFTPNPVVGGLAVTGTLTLSNPAPTGGATVTLTSNNAVVAPVPAGGTVVIAAGQTTGTFTINTTATPGTTVTITASYSNSSLDTQLVVLAAPVAIVPASLSFSSASVNGGNSSQATVTLTGPAPTGGLVVALSSSTPTAQVPASVTIPAGSTSATFTVTTSVVTQQVVATITASAGGTSVTGDLTVLAPTLEKLVLTPPALPGGQKSIGTLNLTFAAPGGAVVALSSDNPAAAQVPATVTIPAGATTTTFTVTTSAVPKAVVVTIKATFAGLSQTAQLEVRAARITGVSVAPASLTGGAPSVGTVTLDSPAAVAAGLVVSLSSSAPAGTVPATVIVPLGATTATFPITTAVVPAPVLDTLTATLDSISKTTVLTIQPIQATSLVLTPPLVVAGLSSVGIVTVNAPAPPGGLVVALSQLGAAETLPATATVPAGATTATFTIGTPVAGTATISAVVGGQTRTATLTVSTAVGTSFPAGLNMISVPYDYSGQSLDTLFGYANVHLATWNTLAAGYAYTPTAPADALHLGRSYFVKLPTAVTLTRVGTPADPTTDFSLPLSAGWNMIGDPFLVPVSLSAMHVSSGGVVSTFSTAVSGAPLLASSLLYSYNQSTNGGKGGYVILQTSGALQPGQGYWIYAYSPVTLIVPHPGR